MTLHIFESTYRDKPCMKCVVRLAYKKDDKTRYCQKTYRAVGEVFKVRLEEVEVGFRAAAKRWEIETLERIKNGQPPELRQEEISMSPPPEKIMKAHQYLYYVKHTPIWTDLEYDKFCKDNGLFGNGGSDLESSYEREIVELAEAMLRQEWIEVCKTRKVSHMRPENQRERHNARPASALDSESEKGGAHVGCTVLLGENRMTKCPQCGEAIVQTNLGGGKTDDYCEECGWPDEDRRHPADPVKCLQQGYRLLGHGDVMRATDETLRGHDWQWVKCGSGLEGWPWDKKGFAPTRRKVNE